jgi:uncharacterized protein YbjT (DUF2867 family)
VGVSPRNILLAGATGLVGGLVLRRLLENRRFAGTVFAPVRRPLGHSDSRLVELQVDFSSTTCDQQLSAAIKQHPANPLTDYVSCLGTTIRAAGSREAFIAIDRDLVLRLGQIAFDLGARHAILVSSVGASRQSGNFYLRVKGEVEDAMDKIGFRRLDILQPGLLLGQRAERRPAEALAQVLAPLANPALIGKLGRYRTIDADAVARAIVRLIKAREAGRFKHQYKSIQACAAEQAKLT